MRCIGVGRRPIKHGNGNAEWTMAGTIVQALLSRLRRDVSLQIGCLGVWAKKKKKTNNDNLIVLKQKFYRLTLYFLFPKLWQYGYDSMSGFFSFFSFYVWHFYNKCTVYFSTPYLQTIHESLRWMNQYQSLLCTFRSIAVIQLRKPDILNPCGSPRTAFSHSPVTGQRSFVRCS